MRFRKRIKVNAPIKVSLGIHVFSRQQALVMNSGKPVYLQFMLIENGKLFYNLYIVGENYVSPNEITDQCLLTDIKRLIVDPTGFLFN
ncbi:unnamed protein product [Rotaria magnacalcarata]|uniref:Uncharacterized protein n=1 Tax=Rotaria magnacalcarata TaxID=392030 RepID=A0A815I320_9BILA|nr:unnamed protein product [Rotaria magnacalcarata]CAF1362944.1 unnamed protein product [Rotaria magnacalcarata]